jgi:hypothetical protein
LLPIATTSKPGDAGASAHGTDDLASAALALLGLIV